MLTIMAPVVSFYTLAQESERVSNVPAEEEPRAVAPQPAI